MAISLRKAINDKCKDCTYDERNGLGTWRQQTELCTVKICPLWEVRPRSAKKASNGGEIPAGLLAYRQRKLAADLTPSAGQNETN